MSEIPTEPTAPPPTEPPPPPSEPVTEGTVVLEDERPGRDFGYIKATRFFDRTIGKHIAVTIENDMVKFHVGARVYFFDALTGDFSPGATGEVSD